MDAQSRCFAVQTFFLPDYTVGPGVSPDHAHSCSRALPPIGNWVADPHPAPKALYSISVTLYAICSASVSWVSRQKSRITAIIRIARTVSTCPRTTYTFNSRISPVVMKITRSAILVTRSPILSRLCAHQSKYVARSTLSGLCAMISTSSSKMAR